MNLDTVAHCNIDVSDGANIDWKQFNFIQSNLISPTLIHYLSAPYNTHSQVLCDTIRWDLNWSTILYNFTQWIKTQCQIMQSHHSREGQKFMTIKYGFMGWGWLLWATSGALCWKHKKQIKQEKIKLLNILTWYDLSRIWPCERARPRLSEYVGDIMVYMI